MKSAVSEGFKYRIVPIPQDNVVDRRRGHPILDFIGKGANRLLNSNEPWSAISSLLSMRALNPRTHVSDVDTLKFALARMTSY